MFLAAAVCSGFCLSSLMSLYVCLYFLCSLWDHMIQMKMLIYFAYVHMLLFGFVHKRQWYTSQEVCAKPQNVSLFRMCTCRSPSLGACTSVPHISVTAFSQTDLFLVWIYPDFIPPQEPYWPISSSVINLNWRHHLNGRWKRQTAIFFFTNARESDIIRRKRSLKIGGSVKTPRHRHSMGVARSYWWAPGVLR